MLAAFQHFEHLPSEPLGFGRLAVEQGDGGGVDQRIRRAAATRRLQVGLLGLLQQFAALGPRGPEAAILEQPPLEAERTGIARFEQPGPFEQPPRPQHVAGARNLPDAGKKRKGHGLYSFYLRTRGVGGIRNSSPDRRFSPAGAGS